jgi:hypothetical protein
MRDLRIVAKNSPFCWNLPKWAASSLGIELQVATEGETKAQALAKSKKSSKAI